ncbi:MAG: hypothetical protein GY913_04585 [Proteobacteria bacterium]|nr:hypothetical protein [Pseudomonadota bacterium]MCP4916179.1 hypothetical protein [Pseudomonadota bacterium]
MQKRRTEAAKMDKKQAKAARKAARDASKAERGVTEDGVDPDLAGITAGPQPRLYEDGDPIWHDEKLA